ncbi:hypothetical protein Q4493_12655 [Colwellia sp. 1_MG-2023]|uniref:hypothetical protein n=1 Tax=Colwellia sp. 1_MG-2023 TaxID=3062649 RepID=UPI0026E43584|nr:hypothetical protein [Colwellia sp. 1_MG-2023]MDO6446627.1 hypothetical protein [Colwellia sp. 1_MG-2023]
MPALFATGFTIGSFLFSMKSVIIRTLKEDVYDHEIYQNKVCQKIAANENIGFYDNLSNFSNLLMKAISWSFISAISQISFGFFESWWASIICLLAAIISWCYLGKAIYEVHANWQDALDYADKTARSKHKEVIEKQKQNPF